MESCWYIQTTPHATNGKKKMAGRRLPIHFRRLVQTFLGTFGMIHFEMLWDGGICV